LREPEDLKERMGGMTARGEEPSLLRRGLKDTGGRDVDFRLSSEDRPSCSALGKSNSRWPCVGDSLAPPSTASEDRRVVVVEEAAAAAAGDDDDSAPWDRRCCCWGLLATVEEGFLSLRVRCRRAVGTGASDSGNDAGRLGLLRIEVETEEGAAAVVDDVLGKVAARVGLGPGTGLGFFEFCVDEVEDEVAGGDAGRSDDDDAVVVGFALVGWCCCCGLWYSGRWSDGPRWWCGGLWWAAVVVAAAGPAAMQVGSGPRSAGAVPAGGAGLGGDTGDGGMCCCNKATRRSFFRSAKRKAGSLDEL